MIGIITRNREAAAYASRVFNRLERAKKEGDRELLQYEEQICLFYDSLCTALGQEESMRGHSGVDMNSELGDHARKIYDEFRKFVGEKLPCFNAELRKQMH